jgi:hypothetical protein
MVAEIAYLQYLETAAGTAAYALQTCLCNKDKYPGSKSHYFVLKKAAATFKYAG